MKIITLIPVKNESWVLRTTLQNISSFSDHIIIADQNSTDGSLQIYKEFQKVIVIQNNNQNHNNSVRWQLLDYAREKFGNKNLIVCIDADEMIQPEAIKKIKEQAMKGVSKSISFSFPWIQLWGSLEKHRVDSVWKNNYKSMAFLDDGTVDYERKTILNDHTSRVPKCEEDVKIYKFPLLHYQYIDLKQSEIKQAWYRCSELISGNDAKRINYKYSIAKNNRSVVLESTNKDWLKGLNNISIVYEQQKDWRYAEIISWFDKYGIKYFEPLDIWNIKELHDSFLKNIKRKPKPKKYSRLLIMLIFLRNKFKK